MRLCAFTQKSVKYLVLLLLLLAQVAAVGVVFDDFLAHVVHSVHQELQAFLQVVTEGRDGHLHNTVTSEIHTYTITLQKLMALA